MKVIIAGGTGMIGKALSLALLQDQHRVSILSRRPEKQRTNFPKAIHLIKWDPSREGWQHHVAGADAIINLAGTGIASGRWTSSRKRSILQSRLAATSAMVHAIQASSKKPGCYIQASAVGYYGPRGQEPVTEQSSPGEDYLANVTKEWEIASQPLEDAGVRRILLRTGIVLSAEGGALPRLAIPFRLFAGGPIGGGQQYMPWIHLKDEVRAIVHLLRQPTSSGVYNLTAPEPVTNRVFAAALGHALRRPSWLPIPSWLLRVVLGEMADTLLHGQRAMPTRLLSEEFQFTFPDLPAALEAIYT